MTASLRLNQLARLTAGYSLALFVGPIFTILLTPLYTRLLSPADYAVLDTLTAIGLFVTALAAFGLGPALLVNYYDGDVPYQQGLLGTAALLGLGWSILLGLILAVLAPSIAGAALGGTAQTGLLLLTALNLPFATLAGLFQTSLRAQLAVRQANILALTTIMLTVGLNILLVLVMRLGIWGIQATTMAVTIWQVGLGLAMQRQRGWRLSGASLIQPLIRAGVGALPGGLALWSLASLDRLILPAFSVPLDERGLYAIAGRLASLLAFVVVPFQSAWAPLALVMRDDPHADRFCAQILTGFVAVVLWCGLAVGLLAREILHIFTTAAYLDAAQYVAPLTYIAVANGSTVAVGVGAMLARRTEVAGLATLAGASLNILLNLVLIPPMGAMGAALATALGYAAMPIMIYIWSQRLHPLPFQPGRLVVALFAQLAFLLLGLGLPPDGAAGLGLRLAVIALYPAALLLLGVVRPAEVRALVRAVGSRGRMAVDE
jgi:O-antigen/teichoic acid export membrane protein